jgi:hypothetical protein
MDTDLQVRMMAFNRLSEQVIFHGDVLSGKLLEQGFKFQGQRIPLIAPQGIFKPQFLICQYQLLQPQKVPTMIIFGRIIFSFIVIAALTQITVIM